MRKKASLRWYVKQLLPLTYVSRYHQEGRWKLAVWKMWFGRCYKIRRFNLAG